MILTTVALAVMLSGPPASQMCAKPTLVASVTSMARTANALVSTTPAPDRQSGYNREAQARDARQRLAVDLHPMTEEEKQFFPGREHWDKTEWYEAQFKSAKVVTAPEHVDEWHNGGMDQA